MKYLLGIPIAVFFLLDVVSSQKPILKGCYKSPGKLEDNGQHKFQSIGYCSSTCASSGFPIFAVTGGTSCFCGREIPPESEKVDRKACNMPCAGYTPDTCGGEDTFEVFSLELAGITSETSTGTTTRPSDSETTADPTTAPTTPTTPTTTTPGSETSAPVSSTGPSGTNGTESGGQASSSSSSAAGSSDHSQVNIVGAILAGLVAFV
ncbi:hypothetical protein FQN57_001810 [Myotisia sp. PD_48]|nr:hypothetical protein FQN57_001810 [Myotisia sp. PD_48]